MTLFSIFVVVVQSVIPSGSPLESPEQQFEQLVASYMDEFPAFSPVAATALGDHRFDCQLDEVSEAAREDERHFCRHYLEQLHRIDPAKLSRASQVDHALLKHELRATLWRQTTLQQWAWNPLAYTGLCGSAIYNLMARDFAPLEKRLGHVADRLEQFPRLYDQIRATLEPNRVPKIHAETAVKQNSGVLSILENMVKPHLGRLSAAERDRLEQAMATAEAEVKRHQRWLEDELLPNAEGDFRLGAELFDQKLAFTLKTPLTRPQVRQRAERELVRVRDEMYRVSQQVYKQKFPYTEFPERAIRALQASRHSSSVGNGLPGCAASRRRRGYGQAIVGDVHRVRTR